MTFDWLRKAVLFFLNWTVSLFVKESFDWQDKIAQQENVLKANFQALTARVNGKTKLSKQKKKTNKKTKSRQLKENTHQLNISLMKD